VGTGSKPKQCNNLNNVRREVSRHFRNKRREYLKTKLEELEIYVEVKNIKDLYRGISDFKMSYQHRTNIVKDEKSSTYSPSFLVYSPKYSYHKIYRVIQNDCRGFNHFSYTINLG
jgi:hypothetical protein